MNKIKRIRRARRRRVFHVRRNVVGSAENPRLAISRSNRHIYCQLIDDEAGRTLVSSSTVVLMGREANGGNREAAEKVGTDLAEKAKGAGIAGAIVDRRHYKFHGRVKSLVEAARKNGLKC